MIDPVCIGCGKRPGELEEYAHAARLDNRFNGDVDAYVRAEEGTYNPKNGHFLCTICYVKQGMPSARGGWKAP
jgi:hypothetical protein